MAVLVPRENLQDEDGALAMSEEETRWKEFIGRDKENEVASQKRRKNEAKRERGTILRGEERARDSIRRASLILESKTTGRETEPLIFRHHFSFASILLPRDGRWSEQNTCSLRWHARKILEATRLTCSTTKLRSHIGTLRYIYNNNKFHKQCTYRTKYIDKKSNFFQSLYSRKHQLSFWNYINKFRNIFIIVKLLLKKK